MKKKKKNKNITSMLIVLIIIIIILLIIFSKTAKEPVAEERNQSAQQNQKTTEETQEEQRYSVLRQQMVEEQIKVRGIKDEKVLQAMLKVPRHRLVPDNVISKAYGDHPLPIGYGQTISQPYIVALMTENLNIREDGKVLEIGTGSGYQAAILAEITDNVYTIEIIDELASRASKNLSKLGYKNIKVKNADGYFGWEEFAPFDAIIVTAAANHVPPPLLEQLKDGGRLVIPLGETLRFQTLTIITKRGNETETRFITGVRFVPMTGKAREG